MNGHVVPVLRLAVLCQSIEVDADGRPFALEHPVHTIRWPDGHTGSYEPPTLELYLQLEDAVGTFYIRCVLRPIGETVELYRLRPLEVPFDGVQNRIIPREVGVVLNGLAFPRPGAYELVVYANHVSLHDPDGRTPIPFPTVRVTVLGPDGSEGGIL